MTGGRASWVQRWKSGHVAGRAVLGHVVGGSCGSRGSRSGTFAFIEAPEEGLELLLVQDGALRVPLAQGHPRLLQPGNLRRAEREGRRRVRGARSEGRRAGGHPLLQGRAASQAESPGQSRTWRSSPLGQSRTWRPAQGGGPLGQEAALGALGRGDTRTHRKGTPWPGPRPTTPGGLGPPLALLPAGLEAPSQSHAPQGPSSPLGTVPLTRWAPRYLRHFQGAHDSSEAEHVAHGAPQLGRQLDGLVQQRGALLGGARAAQDVHGQHDGHGVEPVGGPGQRGGAGEEVGGASEGWVGPARDGAGPARWAVKAEVGTSGRAQ